MIFHILPAQSASNPRRHTTSSFWYEDSDATLATFKYTTSGINKEADEKPKKQKKYENVHEKLKYTVKRVKSITSERRKHHSFVLLCATFGLPQVDCVQVAIIRKNYFNRNIHIQPKNVSLLPVDENVRSDSHTSESFKVISGSLWLSCWASFGAQNYLLLRPPQNLTSYPYAFSHEIQSTLRYFSIKRITVKFPDLRPDTFNEVFYCMPVTNLHAYQRLIAIVNTLYCR